MDLAPNIAISFSTRFPIEVQKKRRGSKHGSFICVRFTIEFQTYRTWFRTWPFHVSCVSLSKFKQNRFGSKHGRFMLYVLPIRISTKMGLVPNMAVSLLCVFPLNNGPGSKRGRFIFMRFSYEFQSKWTWFQTWPFHFNIVPKNGCPTLVGPTHWLVLPFGWSYPLAGPNPQPLAGLPAVWSYPLTGPTPWLVLPTGWCYLMAGPIHWLVLPTGWSYPLAGPTH